MGACNFIEFRMGKTVDAAFTSLVVDNMRCYGTDPYNGTISTCRMSRRAPKVVQKTWGPLAEKRAIKIAEDDQYGEKWEARALDCGRVKGHRGVHMWAFYGWAAS